MPAPLSPASRHSCPCRPVLGTSPAVRHAWATAPFAGRRRAAAPRQIRHPRAAGLVCSAETVESSAEVASTSGVDQALAEDAAEPAAQAPKARVWELDFSSRPILDVRGKKRWELIICDPSRSWTFTRYFPNNKINSTQVRTAPAASEHQVPCQLANLRVCHSFRCLPGLPPCVLECHPVCALESTQ